MTVFYNFKEMNVMADVKTRNMNRTIRQPYTYGNTALQPLSLPEKRSGKREFQKDVENRIEEKVLKSRMNTRIYSSLQILIIAAAMIVILVIGGIYLKQLSGYRANVNKAASLEKQVVELTKDNALLKNMYESHIDYSGIFEYASSIGMTTPGKQQIITYQRSNEEYVEKDGEIPNE